MPERRGLQDSRILFVSHCNFSGNSAYHVLSICNELFNRGALPAIAVPDTPEGVDEVGRPPFPVVSFAHAANPTSIYPDGKPPDLIHAFTPREHVRRLTEQIHALTGRPYLVHLEDNEDAITRDEVGDETFAALSRLPLPIGDGLIGPWRAHPVRARKFVAGAYGVTALLDTLLEHIVDERGIWFWPGFDDVMTASFDVHRTRAQLGVQERELILVYTGNIHASNLTEVRSLYIATSLLRRAGYPIRLIRTGWNHVDMSWLEALGDPGAFSDLGFVSRTRVAELVMTADVLVQPGGPSEFNDYRFPSKLPDFLVSGRPVVLPDTNIGRFLIDGQHALLLQQGDAREIFAAVARVADEPDLAKRLGEGGRAFALENLTWAGAVDRLATMYEQALASPHRPATAGSTLVEGTDSAEPPAKLIAFYLPQFHPIPENDEWWGEGFTEWTNVQRAAPQFPNHHQPQLPDQPLGFYDLRDPSILDEQVRLARSYGIFGFCFYYYWFNGRRVLEKPLNRMLESGRPDFPFCFCWANENWTRRWDGLDSEVLLRQDFSRGWAERFIRELIPALTDDRYISVRGAPLLLIYRANLVPEIARVADRWREIVATEAGLDLHLAAVQSFGITDPRPYGLDAAVEFPPHTERFLMERSEMPGLNSGFAGYLEDFEAVMKHQLAIELPEYAWYRGVMPSWDNTARRGDLAHILVGSSPSLYQTWLRKMVLQAALRSTVDEPLVFINAWNEWAEGTHLEPDRRYGLAWLEATHNGLRDGIRQYFATLGHRLSASEASDHIAVTLPVP
jgi:glycosyltransferase involved in cell wall biosynthesis